MYLHLNGYLISQHWYIGHVGSGNGWCHQVTSHYLNQCWSRSMSPYCISRPQSVTVNSVFMKNFHGSSDICPMGFIYSIQICEISHQTFGPSHQKCTVCPMIFVNTVNSSLPTSVAYMCWWTGLVLVQAMACCMFSAKPLPEPMLSYTALLSIRPLGTNFI